MCLQQKSTVYLRWFTLRISSYLGISDIGSFLVLLWCVRKLLRMGKSRYNLRIILLAAR